MKPCICKGTRQLMVTVPQRLSLLEIRMAEADNDTVPFVTEKVQCWECITESQMLAAVRQAAKLGGWLCYHTHDSRRSEPGFPDLVLVRPPVILFLELKGPKGRATPEQRHWIATINMGRQPHPEDFMVRHDEMVIQDDHAWGAAAEIVHPKRLHRIVGYLARRTF